jgi:transposase-like protein
MTAKLKKDEMNRGPTASKGKAKRRSYRQFSAKEKSEAVLSIWTEKRKPSEVYRELGITYAMLSQWQEQALLGMLTGLEPRVRKEEDRGPALNPKLRKLLGKKALEREGKLSKVQQRLEKVRAGDQRAGASQ